MRVLRLVPILSATILAGGTISPPTMTIYSRSNDSLRFELSKVKEVAFAQGTSAVRRVRNEFCGIRLSGLNGATARFRLSGTPGTLASLLLLDLQGRQLWGGSAMLDASGTGWLVAPAVQGGLVVARYRNEGFSSTKPVPMIGGGR